MRDTDTVNKCENQSIKYQNTFLCLSISTPNMTVVIFTNMVLLLIAISCYHLFSFFKFSLELF